MNDRLRAKCYAGSTLLHGLLVAVVLLSSAFSFTKPVKPEQVIHIVNLTGVKLTDGKTQLPGPPSPTPALAQTPNPGPLVQQPAPQLPQPQPQPQAAVQPPPKTVEPPPKTIVKPKPQPEEEPDEPTPAPTPKQTKVPDKVVIKTPAPSKNAKIPAVSDKTPDKAKPTKPAFDPVKDSLSKPINIGAERRKAAQKQAEEARLKQQQADQQADRKWRDDLGSAATAFTTTTKKASDAVAGIASAPGIVIGVLPVEGGGTGSSGAAYANYITYIHDACFNAWNPPDSVVSSDTQVEVKIVIARDGRVLDSSITKPARSKTLTDSVRRALKTIEARGLRPFPSESTDSQRSFKIVFDLQEKRSLG